MLFYRVKTWPSHNDVLHAKYSICKECITNAVFRVWIDFCMLLNTRYYRHNIRQNIRIIDKMKSMTAGHKPSRRLISMTDKTVRQTQIGDAV